MSGEIEDIEREIEGQQVWEDKIIGHDRVPAGSFLANQRNWRIHPQSQQTATEGSLDVVGWVKSVIVNKRTSPEWGADQNIETMVDGHLRVMLALRRGESTLVPVEYVDLTPNEEMLILASLDPIAALAATDKELLDDILHSIQTDNEALQQMLSELAEREGILGDLPNLDDLADEYGEPGERDFWPVITVQVSPETKEKFDRIFPTIPGVDDAERFDALISGWV